MNLSKLSLDELTQLQKAIAEEKKSRDKIDKDSVTGRPFYQYVDIFAAEFRDLGLTFITDEKWSANKDLQGIEMIDYDTADFIRVLEKNNYKMCDMALGNYTVQKDRRDVMKPKALRDVHVDTKLYKQMSDELIDIFRKYYNMRGEEA